MCLSKLYILISILWAQLMFASKANSDSIFRGVITISHSEDPSLKGLENYLNHNRFRSAYTNNTIDEKSWKKEYSLRLSQTKYFYINGDTLISFSINMIGDTLSSYIQIQNNNYFKSYFSNEYSKMNINYGIEGVKNWKNIKNEDLSNKNLKKYSGNKNQDVFNLIVDHEYNYREQSELRFNFKNIFFKGGIIMNENENYPPSQLNRTNKVINITHELINCKEIMLNLSFSPDENEKPLTVNSIFFQFDTVLLAADLRPNPIIFIHTSEKDSISIANLPGKFKHISYVLDKFNNSSQLNNYSDDLSLAYQNKGVQFYTVFLSENSYKPKKINLLYKSNNDPIYYLKNGKTHPIFKQTKQLSYPISFLFDEKGKIILVNAPPFSNPNLLVVLNRLE